jgi:hypothetical protein
MFVAAGAIPRGIALCFQARSEQRAPLHVPGSSSYDFTTANVLLTLYYYWQ